MEVQAARAEAEDNHHGATNSSSRAPSGSSQPGEQAASIMADNQDDRDQPQRHNNAVGALTARTQVKDARAVWE